LCNLGAVYLKMEQPAKAIEFYQKAAELKPDDQTIRFMLDALTGAANASAAPTEYVKNLFDNYAGYFDKHVLDTLHYQVPQLMHDLLKPYLPVTPEQWRVLDLGCGTGLSGAVFRDIAKHLVGVDISPRILSKAREKNIYDELIEMDIVSALNQLQEKYNLIIAADTLVYLGDLSAIFTACHRLLDTNGLFTFSLEAGNVSPYQLQKTGRFTHTKSYIENLAAQHQLTILQCRSITCRTQEEQPVEGFIFVLAIART
jgi:predicted TPR repeat methyltransferase